jgi:NAD(P)H dehydrogenase (quinone)
MLVHIVYCHPSENSLTAEIRDTFMKGLVDGGHKFSISDLYQIGFQTDMTEAEYLRDAFYDADPALADDVLAEQAKINCSDAIAFIYPVFWTEAPAKLVGWFDRVWRYGFAYGKDKADTMGLSPMKTLRKAIVIACAGNTEEALREQGRLDAMKNVMLGDRIHDRAEVKKFVLLGGTERSNSERRAQMRRQHLEIAYQLGRTFGDNWMIQEP